MKKIPRLVLALVGLALQAANAQTACDSIWTKGGSTLAVNIQKVTDTEITYVKCGIADDKLYAISVGDVQRLASEKFKLPSAALGIRKAPQFQSSGTILWVGATPVDPFEFTELPVSGIAWYLGAEANFGKSPLRWGVLAMRYPRNYQSPGYSIKGWNGEVGLTLKRILRPDPSFRLKPYVGADLRVGRQALDYSSPSPGGAADFRHEYISTKIMARAGIHLIAGVFVLDLALPVGIHHYRLKITPSPNGIARENIVAIQPLLSLGLRF